ncbi:MAG: hypothetical protein Q9222_004303 [Ikaeria aurantiellina]
MEALNQAEQQELQSRMEKKQIKEFMTIPLMLELHQLYSKMVQTCFDACVNDFTSKALHTREESCVMRCVDKQQKATERVGLRFQEQNAALMQSGQLPGR